MRIRFIYNPRSGREGRAARLLPVLRDFVATRRPDAELIATDNPGHATELARDAAAAGCRRVVAVGGDGTVNEVAQGLLGTPVELGLVPCGSGNGLARHLLLPGSPLSALALAADPQARVAILDTGVVNGLPFFNIMGFGLDAEMGRSFNQLAGRGLPAYLRSFFAVFAARRTESCRIGCAGRREVMETLMVAAANSDQYGNGAVIAPGARADDGILDLVAVRPVGFAGAAILAARLFLGTFDRSPRVRRWRGTRFELERPAAALIHTDGESHEARPVLEIAIGPVGLRAVIPASFRASRDSSDHPRHP